jgi:TonB family protein
MRKLTISTRSLITLFVILTFHAVIFSQTETYSVPAKWELYSVKSKNVSFLMPRLPVVIEQGDRCRGEESRNYAAYNEGVVYVLKITSKVKAYEFCSPRKEFDESNFQDRVKFVKSELKDPAKSENNIAPDSVIKLVGKTSTNKVIKLINDYKNKRWFELSVYGADETKDEVNKFLASFTTDKSTTGIDIREGAERVFGDDAASIIEEFKFERNGKTETGKRTLVKIEDKTERGVIIILKTRANYTEAARQTQTQGKVVLRVTFQANGAIGDISVIAGLSNGLTEEAIKAARKILFIPAQRDGARYSVTKPVEYTFTIY